MYSVYNVATKRYDYYEGSGPKQTHAGAPPISNAHSLGATVESAAWRMPMDARKVGTGDLPRGRIARGGARSLGDFASGDAMKIGAVALVAYLAWRHLR